MTKLKCCLLCTDASKKQAIPTPKGPVAVRPWNCKAINVLYVVRCRVCDTYYVGKTKMKTKRRFVNHRSELKNFKKVPRPCALSRHFHHRHPRLKLRKNIEVWIYSDQIPESSLGDAEDDLVDFLRSRGLTLCNA